MSDTNRSAINTTNKSSPLTEWSATGLAREFNCDPKTMRLRIRGLPPHRVQHAGSGDRAFYYMSDVVKFLVDNEGQNEEGLDIKKETALLNQARRKKLEIETNILNGQVCRVEDVKHHWAEHIRNAKAKMLSLPTKLSTVLLTADGAEEIDLILTRAIHECLDELSGDGIPATAVIAADTSAGSE